MNTPGTQDAGEVARQHLSIEQQEKEAARKRLQEKILARIAEIQSVDKLIYQSGLKNQFNYKLKIDAVCISTKCIKPEISLDDPQKNCLRPVNEEIYTILGVSKYDQYLKAKGIETIDIDLFDNRTSARSDKMFWVGSDMTSKTVKDKLTYDKTVTTSKYFHHFTKVMPGPESKFGYDFTETRDYEWDATKEEYEAGNKDKQKDSYDYYYKKDTHSKKYKQTYKKINELKISAMLNSKGECVSLTNGLVTEFEAMTNPEDFKIINNEIKVSPAGINNKTKKRTQHSIISRNYASKTVYIWRSQLNFTRYKN